MSNISNSKKSITLPPAGDPAWKEAGNFMNGFFKERPNVLRELMARNPERFMNDDAPQAQDSDKAEK